MSLLEAEYLPYHIKVLPLIFSHIGILFAYHTTCFLSNPAILPTTREITSTSFGASANDSDATRATMSFQKNLVFFKFHTQTP